jgi:acetyl esterase
MAAVEIIVGAYSKQVHESENMTYDPQVQAYLEQLANMPARPTRTLTVEQLRRGLKRTTPPSNEPIGQVEDKHIPGTGGDIPIRIYRPYTARQAEILPVLLFFHGGGFVMGNLDSHDNLCRRLANGAGCLLVAVDYRLAPEHKFPAAPQDCFSATCWVASNARSIGGDEQRIAVCGDSAGGSLATIVVLMARDHSGPALLLQVLFYPGTDLRIDSHSNDEEDNSPFFDKETLDWFNALYIRNEADRLNPLGSPLLAASLAGLPPALIIVAQYDPLRTDGERYAQRLRDEGVAVTLSHYEGMIHSFLTINAPFEQAQRAVEQASRALRTAFFKG